MENLSKTIKNSLAKDWLRLAIQIVAYTGIVASAYFGLRNSINEMNFRILAVEETLDTRPALIERFVVVEEKTNSIEERLIRIEAKVDTLLTK